MIRRGLALILVAAALVFGVWLTAASPRPPPVVTSPLAALAEAEAWLNTSEPITAESLRGRIVLVVFWASSNPRALQALPTVGAWHARYRDYGLEIVGVHTPDYPFEASADQVAVAVERLAMPYPVAVDSRRRIWRAFRASEWPSYYVAGADGAMLGFQVGAGQEPHVEQYLQSLLVERGWLPPTPAAEGWRTAVGELWTSRTVPSWSPEMRFQLPVGEWFVGSQPPVLDQPRAYRLPDPLPLHAAALDGVWQFEDDRARVVSPTGRVVMRYQAAQCHLIVEGAPGTPLAVRLDGGVVPLALAGPDLTLSASDSVVRLDQPRAYTVVRSPQPEVHTVEIVLPRDAAIYACTFTG